MTVEGLQKGDRIEYIPHKHYALQVDAKGDRSWKIGIRRNTGRMQASPDDPTQRVPEVEVLPLEGMALGAHLDYIRRHPNPREEMNNLVLLEPAQTWPGVVTSMDDDGSYQIDCLSYNSGVTLHLRGVSFDPNRKSHHSCHRSSHTLKIGG